MQGNQAMNGDSQEAQNSQAQAKSPGDSAEKALKPNDFLKIWATPIIHFTMTLVVGGTLIVSSLPFLLFDSIWAKIPFLLFMPFTFPAIMIGICAVINKPFQPFVVSGIFPRDLSLPLYFGRRIYGVCLATLMHFSGIYYIILSMPWLKKAMYRSFGYEGKFCNFTTYTDVWIRDVKLLDLGDAAYLGNQSTLGTNICTTDGNLLVGRIKIGSQTQLGRLCILAPGTRFGNNCETGVRTILGIRAIAKNRVKIAAAGSISHGVVLEDDVTIGEYSYIGSKAHIHSGVTLPVVSNIKAGTIILDQEAASKYNQKQVDEIQASIVERMNLMNNNPAHLS